MNKKLKGSTLIYDATEKTYLRTDVYMSEDPSETVELCVVDEAHPRFSDGEIDDSSGPWKRIIEPKTTESTETDEPFLLEKKHRKPDSTRTRRPTEVLPDQKKSADKKSLDKPVWVRFEAEVLGEDGLLKVPERLHFLAKASGDRVEVRMRLVPSERSGRATDTLDGLPTIGRH